jgi:hypothetical protein
MHSTVVTVLFTTHKFPSWCYFNFIDEEIRLQSFHNFPQRVVWNSLGKVPRCVKIHDLLTVINFLLKKSADRVTQVVELLSSKYEAQSSNPSFVKKKKGLKLNI